MSQRSLREGLRKQRAERAGLGLHVIQFPSGRFGFAGRVPLELAYRRADGSTPTEAEVADDLRLPGNFRALKARTFATAEEACASRAQAAPLLGHAFPDARVGRGTAA